MAISKQRGAFLLLEGCDRSGKSTQCERLVQALKERGLQVELMKFPDRTTSIGKVIHEYLQGTMDLSDEAVHLLFSANRWEAKTRMQSLLLSGTHLVVDRYAYSGIVFSAAKPDVGLLIPDVTLFLDVPTEVAMMRGGFGGERYETESLQRKVRQLFLELKDSSWQVIDGTLCMNEVSNAILKMALETMDRVGPLELQEGLFSTSSKFNQPSGSLTNQDTSA